MALQFSDNGPVFPGEFVDSLLEAVSKGVEWPVSM